MTVATHKFTITFENRAVGFGGSSDEFAPLVYTCVVAPAGPGLLTPEQTLSSCRHGARRVEH